MSEQSASFMEKSAVKATDRDHRHKINFNISKYNAVVQSDLG
jgi:L-lactate dehydrogenase complex protein LldF